MEARRRSGLGRTVRRRTEVTALEILTPEIEETFHEDLDLDNGIDIATQGFLLRILNGSGSFDLDLP